MKEEDRKYILKFLEDIRLSISREDVFRLLGRRNKTARGRTAKRLNGFVSRARSLIEPKVLYSTRKIAGADKGTVTLEGGISLKSGKLSKTLGNCDAATVFLATIGTEIDSIIKELSSENKLSDAYIYDAIGSVAVEGAVNDFQNRMDVALSDTRNSTTVRFSPGYCDWSIKEQTKIFDLLDGEAAGVSLSPNFIMNPRKSVTGVFGINPGPAEARPNPCTLCSKESCIARR
jgi:hypothetical protein